MVAGPLSPFTSTWFAAVKTFFGGGRGSLSVSVSPVPSPPLGAWGARAPPALCRGYALARARPPLFCPSGGFLSAGAFLYLTSRSVRPPTSLSRVSLRPLVCSCPPAQPARPCGVPLAGGYGARPRDKTNPSAGDYAPALTTFGVRAPTRPSSLARGGRGGVAGAAL